LVACAPTAAPDRVAAILAMEAESAARLAAEGELLYYATWIDPEAYKAANGATALLEDGELRRGIREASKALFVGQSTTRQDVLAFAKRDLAYAYSLAGSLARAAQFATEAIQHAEAAPAAFQRVNRHRVLGPAFKIRGDSHLRSGRAAEAFEDYERSVTESAPDFRPFALVSLANAHLAVGQLARARELFQRAEREGGAAVQPFIRRGEGEIALRAGRHAEAVRLFVAATQSTGDDHAYHHFWALEGLARARVAGGDRAGGLEAYRQAVAAAEQVRARFRSDEFKTGFFGDMQAVFDAAVSLAAEAGQSEAALELSERSRARALLDLLRGRGRASAGAQAVADPRGRVAPVAEVRAALPDGLALVQYHVLAERVQAWVIRRSGITPVMIDTGREALARAAEGFRLSIRERSPEAQERGRDLYRRLIAPLGLRQNEDLAVVPHGVLHYVPFQALRGPSGYLIEDRAVSYMPSASAAVALLARGPESRQALLALGNPDLGTSRLDLPGAQVEVDRIGAVYPGAEVYVRREATKVRLMARAPLRQLVHVAAHADIDPIDPMYSRIHLAPTERASGELEAHEVYRMDLTRASLVTLSACDTGLGRVSRGDEVWGFTRAFLNAGASALVVSLWPVADDSTPLLMEHFYRSLREQPARRALRAGQLAVLRAPRTAHPFFWAPFSLVGDWR